MAFQKATKAKAKLRLALYGPSGSGKTYTALAIATAMGGKVAVIDTEHGSASKYADLFGFDVLELESFYPKRYTEAIREAEAAGYDTLIIDSLSHAWAGKDGILETVDKLGKQQQGGNFGAWRDVTPLQNELIDTIIGAKCHIIATMRAKTEYAMEANDKGRMQVRKLGLAPVQKDSAEYEFDVAALMDQENNLIVTKSRCPELSGAVINKPGKELADTLLAWLSAGASPAPAPAPPEKPTPAAEQLQVIGCQECGATLAAKNGRTVPDLVIASQDKFGRILCYGCAKDALTKNPAPTTTIPPELDKPAARKTTKTEGDK